MASKRQLKKRISAVCGELASELLLASHIIDGIDRTAVNKLIGEIAALQINARDRVGVAFDKTPRDFADRAEYNKARNAYYTKAFESLRKEFGAKVVDLVKEMNQVIPADKRAQLAQLA